MLMSKRSYKPEIMDLGPSFYTDEEYDDCLRKLGLIGMRLGGDAVTLQAFDALAHTPTSILDVGSGGGSFTMKLAAHFPETRVVGIDIVPEAIIVAQTDKIAYERALGEDLGNLSFELRSDACLTDAKKSFDVVTATLVCHHLKDDELIQFLRDACSVARYAVIINDLHRSSLAYAAYWLISPLFGNRMIRSDGLLSIRKSFVRADWEHYLVAAGLKPESWRITWKWPFRWIVTIQCA